MRRRPASRLTRLRDAAPGRAAASRAAEAGGTFGASARARFPSAAGKPLQVAAGDFDGDGVDDVAVRPLREPDERPACRDSPRRAGRLAERVSVSPMPKWPMFRASRITSSFHGWAVVGSSAR